LPGLFFLHKEPGKIEKELHEKKVCIREFSNAEAELKNELMTFLFQGSPKKD